MARLPTVSGRELISALSKIGYEPVRQKGTLRAILKATGLSVEELIELLRQTLIL